MALAELKPEARDRLALAALLVAGLGLWLAMRPYSGFTGDGRLYLGSALAALDPAGVGRDVLFVSHGQFEFTVFPLLARALVGLVGLSAACLSLSLLGLVAWLASLALLCRRLEPGGGAWLIAAAVILLPGTYDGVSAFHYGEAQATPRVFAEALGLFGLAALLDGRRLLAFSLLLAAFCFHPLMALGAAGAAMLWLCLADRRWLWLLLALAAAGVLGALAGLPLLSRLLAQVSPAWRAVIWDRSENILISHWSAAFWSLLLIHAAALAVAARRTGGAVGRLMWAGLAAGLLGLAAAWLLGDLAGLVLVLQLQTWRALWLVVLLGNAALAMLVLGRDGDGAGLRSPAVMLLMLAWALAETPVLALPVLAASGAAALAERRGGLKLSAALVAAGWLAIAVVVLIHGAVVAAVGAAFVGTRPSGASMPFQVWQAPIDIFALAVLIGLFLARGRLRIGPRTGLAGAAVLLLAAGFAWDARPAAQRQAEDPGAAPVLRRAVAARPGEVLWANGDTEPWIWLGRPSWTSSMQGAGVVFSDKLARLWDQRTRAAGQAGLFSPEGRTPFRTTPPVPIHTDPARLEAFCARADAPAWVVLPDLTPADPLRRQVVVDWRAPSPTFQPSFAGQTLSWHGASSFSLLPCRTTP